MRIDALRTQNFRGYEDREFILHPQFNLVIGENRTGKTSFLEAAAVAVSSWLLGIPGHDSRAIRERDVRKLRDVAGNHYSESPQYPVRISVKGAIHIAQAARNRNTGEIAYKEGPCDQQVAWSRSLEGVGGRTTQAEVKHIKKIAEEMVGAVYKRKPRILPLIRYFGAGRVWESMRDLDRKSLSKHKKQLSEPAGNADEIERLAAASERLSDPFYGYRLSVDKRCTPDDLIAWMMFERRHELDKNEESPALRLVFQAIQSMLPEVESAHFCTKLGTLILHHHNGEKLTFGELSDGSRNIAAIAADIAIKAVMLNPLSSEKALELTPGVVLIDELDLHLHPKWQGHVIEDLRRTFPKIQFICTTHSPFLIRSLRSNEELITLDGQPTDGLTGMSLDEIAQRVMGGL